MLETIKSSFKDINKKTLLYAGIGIGGFLVLILIITLVARMSIKSYKGYEDVEVSLVEAAEKYYADNSEFLPTTVKTTTVVSSKTLSSNGYISPLEELLKNGSECSAQVVVTKLESGYDYTPYLDCGEYYSSLELYNRILEDNEIVDEGIGLYRIDNEHVFRGEVKNNFVMLNDKLWRIMRIDEENNVVLISEFKTKTFAWDDRYNEETSSSDGINNYNLSRIKDTIETQYYNDEIITKNERSKVVSDYLCVGARTYESTSSRLTTECVTKSEELSPIGLITASEYMMASIDENCKTVFDKTCINYNYLTSYTSSYWTITPGVKKSSYAYAVSTSGITESRAATSKQIRYVIKLGTKAIYNSGSGTQSDPYKIR